jgi:small-conductance mechanosensitive channel
VFASIWESEWAQVTQAFARWALTRGLSVIGILLGAWLLIGMGNRALKNFEKKLSTEDAASGRGTQRSATLAHVSRNTITIAIAITAGLLVLNQVGLNLGPLLAGAGIAGLAVGFGAQTLVKDVVNGFFILLEDQYRVGDTVEIEGTTGVVQDFTLRKTTLRCPDGKLFYVSNGIVQKLFNASDTITQTSGVPLAGERPPGKS